VAPREISRLIARLAEEGPREAADARALRYEFAVMIPPVSRIRSGRATTKLTRYETEP